MFPSVCDVDSHTLVAAAEKLGELASQCGRQIQRQSYMMARTVLERTAQSDDATRYERILHFMNLEREVREELGESDARMAAFNVERAGILIECENHSEARLQLLGSLATLQKHRDHNASLSAHKLLAKIELHDGEVDRALVHCRTALELAYGTTDYPEAARLHFEMARLSAQADLTSKDAVNRVLLTRFARLIRICL